MWWGLVDVIVLPTVKGLAAVHLFAFLANKKGVLLLTLPRWLDMNAGKFSKAVGCHNCGDSFIGEIIKTRKGIYCSFCGQVFPDGLTPMLIKKKIVKKARRW